MLPALRKCESERTITCVYSSLSDEMMKHRELEKKLTFSELVTVISTSQEDMSG